MEINFWFLLLLIFKCFHCVFNSKNRKNDKKHTYFSKLQKQQSEKSKIDLQPWKPLVMPIGKKILEGYPFPLKVSDFPSLLKTTLRIFIICAVFMSNNTLLVWVQRILILAALKRLFFSNYFWACRVNILHKIISLMVSN
jgi:hypothetical protein